MQFVQSDDIGKIHKHRSVNFCTSMFSDSGMFWNLAGSTKNRTSMTLNSFQRLFVWAGVFIHFHCWSHRYVGGLLGAVPIYVSFRFFFNKNVKSHVSTRGQLGQATPVIDYVCLCFICAHKKSYMGHLQKQGADPCFSWSFKLMQVRASDQSGFCILPHKSQGLPLRY